MERRSLGLTGLTVSSVGLGAGRIGDEESSQALADRLVRGAIDAGVCLFDTARSYGLSEERLGRALAGRREGIVLSTKVGYGVPGIPDWTGPCVSAGVEAALARLRTDRLDVVHLHSCGLDVLRRGEVVEALLRAVEAGKVRVGAYSGEGDALDWAIRCGAFGSIQCSLSVADQVNAAGAVGEARARGLGVLVKRPLADAPWRFAERPAAPDMGVYWDRFQALRLEPGDLPWAEFLARFAAFVPGVSAILVGTADPAHLGAIVEAVGRGPLPEDMERMLRAAFAREGATWVGVV
jgi:aryl-alcohol dehydrogenase-like predicted oxidoreductase